jgi:menaquinone-dependent protoporphyrinogen oxidase
MIKIAILLMAALSLMAQTEKLPQNRKESEVKTAIIYASKHGTTEKVARLIQQKITDGAELFFLKEKPQIDLKRFENVIIGASIHAGSIQTEVKHFMEANQTMLLEKNLALYLCCMNEAEEKAQFENNYPEALRNHSLCNAIVGGEYLLEKMNFVERYLVKKIAGATESVSKLRYEEIKKVATAINQYE